MIIQPVVAPSLSNLTVTPALKGNLLKWDVVNNSLLLGAQIWASQTNDRATATKVSEVFDNTFMHLTSAGSAWYYWIRGISVYERADGAWLPVSATAGVQSTTLLAQTEDIAQNAITSVIPVQSVIVVNQTAYSTWERVFTYPFHGTGNYFIIDLQHLANITLTTLGTAGSAYTQQRLGLDEHTVVETGTVSATNGSAIVTGSGTSWLSQLSAGDVFGISGLSRYSIASVDSDTQITLSAVYLGTTVAGSSYYVITSTASVFTLSQTNDKFQLQSGTYLSYSFPFRYRIPVECPADKLYDIVLDWSIVRSDTSWSMSNQSILRTLILEEVKR